MTQISMRACYFDFAHDSLSCVLQDVLLSCFFLFSSVKACYAEPVSPSLFTYFFKSTWPMPFAYFGQFFVLDEKNLESTPSRRGAT